MSVTLSKPETYDCERAECDNTRTEATSVGSYCSERCAWLADGRELLNIIKHDHRFCAGCYRQLKEIERPPPKYRLNIGPVDHEALEPTLKNCLVGYEYITEHAELGERTHTRADHAEHHPDAVAPADQYTVSGVVCSCGTTDTQDPWVRDAEIVSTEAAATRLCDLLELLGREGQHDKSIHAPTLLEAVEAHQEDGHATWQLAVGQAVAVGRDSS